MMPSNTPTEEDFDRASAMMGYRHRDWDEITATARTALSKIFDLHEFAIFPNDCEFAAILFFRTNQDVLKAQGNGSEDRARDILTDIVRPFRPECKEIKILVELDSHENVTTKFDGSYFNRLR